MNKKQACNRLRIRTGTIDNIRKSCNLQSTHYFVQRKKPKKKNKETEKKVVKP